jgi:hypothetical protein
MNKKVNDEILWSSDNHAFLQAREKVFKNEEVSLAKNMGCGITQSQTLKCLHIHIPDYIKYLIPCFYP